MGCHHPRNIRSCGRGKKLVEWWGWFSDANRAAYCETCKKSKKTPPCETCEYGSPPNPLAEENVEAVELWADVQTQWRAGPFGLIGLDYSEVRSAATELDIEWCLCIKRKIQAMERFEIKRAQPKADPNKRS